MFRIKRFFQKSCLDSSNILLKFDDFSGKVTRWNTIYKILKKHNINAAFGVIGSNIENLSNKNILWIKKLSESGRVQFFNHGYTHAWKSDFEFEGKSIKEQSLSIQRTQKVFFEKTGIVLTCFGAPCNKRDTNTYNALLKNPEINTWFIENSNIKYRLGICTLPLDSESIIEPDGFTPCLEFHGNDFFSINLKTFKENFKKSKLIVLQGHPMGWSKTSLHEFVKIIKWLKSQNCKFILPQDVSKI